MPRIKGQCKGLPKTGGRKKGVPNILTRDLRAAIEHAFDRVGGESYLVKVARSDPRTFCALLARVLPVRTEHDVGALAAGSELSVYERARRIAFALELGDRARMLESRPILDRDESYTPEQDQTLEQDDASNRTTAPDRSKSSAT